MKYVLGILALSWNLCLVAQSIQGKVHDASDQAIEFATVRLFSLPDSTVKGGAVTDLEGKFKIDQFALGAYYLKITFAGHEPLILNVTITEATKELKLGTLKLSLDKTLELEGVVAKGSLDVLKAGIDKKIYTTADDISVRGGNVQDVLNNIPSITVDQDGNISLRGDANVTILIDGRPSALVMGDGKNLLNSLPANSIERVEVVTNPSAKYDPDGTSGIINIVLKKNKIKGTSGLISATAATGNLYEANLALSYRNNKFNSYFNYSMNFFEGYRNFYSELTRNPETDSMTQLIQERTGEDHKLGNTAVLGFDYYFNDRNSFSFSSTGTLGGQERTGDLQNYYYDDEGVLLYRSNRASVDPEDNKNLDFNANYMHKLKEEKGEWVTNFNQSYGDESIHGYYRQFGVETDGTLSEFQPLDQRLSNSSHKRITTAQTDFSYILKSWKARIETGAKAIIGSDLISTYSEAMDTLNASYFEDTLANFEYRYDHSVYSLYGTFGQELGKFKYQLGVRGEYATQSPYLISENYKINNYFTNVFPSGHLKYVFTKSAELSLSYSRRINRPRSGQLNPFTSYADPMNLRTGNPFLQPEYIDSYDLGYSLTKKKFIMTLSVFYRNTSDVINRVRLYYPNNTSVVTFDNIDKSESTGLESVFIIKPFSWWKTSVSFNSNYMKYTDASPGNDWNNSGLNWGGKFMTSFDFWKGSASFQVNYNYNAPWVTPQGRVQRRTGLDLSLEKRLFENKLSIVAKCSDVFNRIGFYADLEQTGVEQHNEFKWLSRRFYITVSYKFGKFDTKLKTPKSSGGGGDE